MTMPAMQFRRAVRQAVRLKIGIDGPSGSGKTEGALALARGLVGPAGRIALADTENESASYYADRYVFDTVAVAEADALVLMDVIRLAVAEKYDALVIDSLSHAWLKILEQKDAYMLDNPRANSWTAWGMEQFGPRWSKLMKLILDAPIHVLSTMRSKQAHEQVTHDGGKKEVVKLGLQPQVREGAEYEFGLVFSVNMAHRAEATKDRTHLFTPGQLVDLCSAGVHAALVGWMNQETTASDADIARVVELSQYATVPEVTRKAVRAKLDSQPGAATIAKMAAQLEQYIAEHPVAVPDAFQLQAQDVASEARGHVASEGEERPDPTVSSTSTTTSTVPQTDAAMRASVGTVVAQLRMLIANDALPMPAVRYFRQEKDAITENGHGLIRARRAVALCALALRIGERVQHPAARGVEADVLARLAQPDVYDSEALTAILTTIDECIAKTPRPILAKEAANGH